MRRAAVLAGIVLLAACNPAPVRQDPLAGLGIKNSGNAPCKDLTLAYILSPNSVAIRKYLDETAANTEYKRIVREDVARVMPAFMDGIKSAFKSTVVAEDMAAAKASGADAIGVLDLAVRIAPVKGSSSKMDEKLILVGPDGSTLETLTAHGESRFSWTGPIDHAGKAAEMAAAQLRLAMAGSQYLQQLQAARASGKPAAVAAAPRPSVHSDVDEPSYAPAEPSERNLALVVGIEKYESLPPADYAERDAAAVRRHLLALGYPERNVVFLTGQRAGRAGIEKYVESWLPEKATADSRVFVYFSGHGAPDTKSAEAYLVPWDGDPKFLANTGYPLKRLYAKLAALPAKQVVVALDSCFSGEGGRSVLPRGVRPLVTKLDTAESVAAGRVTVLAAAGPDEITGALDAQGHGLFTYYLLKGLNAKGGEARVRDLYDYLKPQVEDAARGDNRDQTPRLLASREGAAASLR